MTVNLSRKNKRALKEIRQGAGSIWDEQKKVLGHAGEYLGVAAHNSKQIVETDLLPAARDAYDRSVAPVVDKGVNTVKGAVGSVADKVNPVIEQWQERAGDVVKDIEKKPGVKKATKRGKKALKEFEKKRAELQKRADKAWKKANKKDQGMGVGGWVALTLGLAAVAGVAYAVWQTFRADDDLWIADEELDAPRKPEGDEHKN